MCPAGTYGNETGLVGYSTIQCVLTQLCFNLTRLKWID